MALGTKLKVAMMDWVATQLSKKVPLPEELIVDCHMVSDGFYRYDRGGLNKPSAPSGTVISRVWDSNFQTLLAIDEDGDLHVAVKSGVPGAWKNWRKWATDTPPQESPLPLAEGYIVAYGQKSCFYKSQDGLVVVHVSVGRADGESLTNTLATVATLPQGFRPSGTVLVAPTFGHYLSANTSGTITCHALGGNDSLGGTLVFYAAPSGPIASET